MKTTITTVQRNTKQVQPGYWTTTLPNSHKVVSNIVKIASGEYGCTHDLSRHNSFMACLAHIMPLFKEAVSVARKAFVKRIALGSLLVAAGVITGAARASEGGLAASNGFPAAYDEINTALHDPNGRDFNRAVRVAENRLGVSAGDAEALIGGIETGRIKPMTTLTPAVTLHQTATATPDIDRSQHLDGIHPEHVSESVESSKADKKAERNTVDHTPPTETVKGRYTVKNYLKANTPRDGVNGKDGVTGAAGKDGVTTVITRSEVDTVTQQQVSHNTTSITNNRADINRLQSATDQNSKRISDNSKRIDETRKEMHQIGNNAAAMSSLHFNANADSWALSTGSAGDGAAFAAGLQKHVGEHEAVTFQASTSADGGYMVGAGIHGDW